MDMLSDLPAWLAEAQTLLAHPLAFGAVAGAFGLLLTLVLLALLLRRRRKKRTTGTQQERRSAPAPVSPSPAPVSRAPAPVSPGPGSGTRGSVEAPAPIASSEEAPSPERRRPNFGRQDPMIAESEAAPEPEYTLLDVFFGTDREKITGDDGLSRFGGGRGAFSYGGCRVSIPKEHRAGQVEKPKWWRLEFSPTPSRHVMLREVMHTDKPHFFESVTDRVKNSGSHQALLFVHGFNVSFEDAALRTAQMTYDLNFDGAPIFYSWPSLGGVPNYAADEATIEWATPNLKGFIKDILDKSAPVQLHLIAHSMGSRALTQALMQLKDGLSQAHKAALKEVILAAPDIDADVFLRDIAPAIHDMGARLTLYAASDDKALDASQKVHRSARAGDFSDLPAYPEGADVVDATLCDTGFLGHTPFSGRSMISDMFGLLTHGHGPGQRMLREMHDERGRYWRIDT